MQSNFARYHVDIVNATGWCRRGAKFTQGTLSNFVVKFYLSTNFSVPIECFIMEN